MLKACIYRDFLTENFSNLNTLIMCKDFDLKLYRWSFDYNYSCGSDALANGLGTMYGFR